MIGLTDAIVEFGLIPPEHWHQPEWIDEEKAAAAREEMAKNNVIYGGALNPQYCGGDTLIFFYFQGAYRKYKDTFVLASVLDIDVPKISEHVSLQLRRKAFLLLLSNRLTYSTLVFLQARALSEIQVLLAGGVSFSLVVACSH